MSVFCIEAEEIRDCTGLTLFTYKDNVHLVSKLFAIFQIYIPQIAEHFEGSSGEPIKILKEDITLTPPESLPPMGILLQPTDDLSNYGEDFSFENSVYVFEAFLHVRGAIFENNEWDLIKLESIVKTLISGLEEIMQNGFTVSFDGFRYLGTETQANYYVRTGITRFTLRKRSEPKTIKL